MSRVLVTGASGFLGNALCGRLLQQGEAVRATTRSGSRAVRTQGNNDDALQHVTISNISMDTDWRCALEDVQVVVHLAARVHVMREQAADPLTAFREINVAGTERLAKCAASEGVRRLVYVSTVKVHGENTFEQPFVETDAAKPIDPYAQSKHEAEQVIRNVAASTGMEYVIVRPPLVYGPGVKGNFLSLLNAVHRGLPLPLLSCHAPRSLVGLSNLVDLLISCTSHKLAAGEEFLVSDQDDMTMPQLVRQMAAALGVRPRLFSVKPALLRMVSRAFRSEALYDRLCVPLQVSAGKATRILGWHPRVSVEEELANVARWYLDDRCRVGAGGGL